MSRTPTTVSLSAVLGLIDFQQQERTRLPARRLVVEVDGARVAGPLQVDEAGWDQVLPAGEELLLRDELGTLRAVVPLDEGAFSALPVDRGRLLLDWTGAAGRRLHVKATDRPGAELLAADGALAPAGGLPRRYTSGGRPQRDPRGRLRATLMVDPAHVGRRVRVVLAPVVDTEVLVGPQGRVEVRVGGAPSAAELAELDADALRVELCGAEGRD